MPSRREFLFTAAVPTLAASVLTRVSAAPQRRGPGARYTPLIAAAFVRRRSEYGIAWPGAMYDGEAARRRYTRELRQACQALGLHCDLRAEPLYSEAEATQWLSERTAAGKPDGILMLLLDRQPPAWPAVARAIATGIPTVAFAPIGAAMTLNTMPLAQKEGVLICSTSDFQAAGRGLKAIAAGARLREMRFVVIKGATRRDTNVGHFGTHIRYVPASAFAEEYAQITEDKEVQDLAGSYLRQATRISGCTRRDVLNGVRSYFAAQRIMEREDGDGISMDCLGALGATKISLPCIAWSAMLDAGIPAACEADISAALTHALVQFICGRPGFQQDPVPETARKCLVGAHCSCPTKLNGFQAPAEPYFLSRHHGNRDAVPVTEWRVGQKITVADVLLPNSEALRDDRWDWLDGATDRPQLMISTGTVVENLSVPPEGGCVVSVMVRMDRETDLLAYPGFHQVFLYGDFASQLRDYATLFRIQPRIV